MHLSVKRMILGASDRKVAMVCDCFGFRTMLDQHASLMEAGIEREGEAKVVDNIGSLWTSCRRKGSAG